MTESDYRLLCRTRLAAMPARDRRLWVDLTASEYLTAIEAGDRPEWGRIRRLADGLPDLALALDETLDSLIGDYEAARGGV